jgi:tRNA-specific 2-thiouridylase
MRERVVVAMSGGVDSSVASACLVESGYEVIGVTLKIWPTELCEAEHQRSCCSIRGINDARRITEKLKIPFYVVNAVDDFKKDVIQYFVESYFHGMTPNPCIACNTKIKFGLLLQKANELGASFVATGHYAKVGFDERRGRYLLLEGSDKRKDQSYVLFELSQAQLAKTILPLGDYTKTRVRAVARQLQFENFNKPDSQEVCFIHDNNPCRFLSETLKDRIKPGTIVDMNGKVVGKHAGICFFTVGQRKRLGVAAGRPLYVVAINACENEIVVGDLEDLKRGTLVADRVNWVSVADVTAPLKVKAKIRYAHPKADCTVFALGGTRIRVDFDDYQTAVTPGQAVVFYDDDTVMGGGWITGEN